MLAAMPSALRLAATFVATVVLATGCARGVSVRGDWEAGGPRPGAFGNVVVVGVSPDFNQRCAFERALVATLRSAAVAATPACDDIGSKDAFTREAVEAIVARTGADAVVVTLLVERAVAGKEGGTRDTRGAGYYKPVGYGFDPLYYGAYGVPVVYGEYETAPTVTVVRGSVTLATNVYETRNATVVYGITTKAGGLESRGDALARIAPAIADHLRAGGVVR